MEPITNRTVNSLLDTKKELAGHMTHTIPAYKLFTKGGEILHTKSFNLWAVLFRCKFWVDVSLFSSCVFNFSGNKNVLRLKKFGAKSRARVYFEQQILLLLVFHQTRNMSRNKFGRQVEGFYISYFADMNWQCKFHFCHQLFKTEFKLSFQLQEQDNLRDHFTFGGIDRIVKNIKIFRIWNRQR